MEFGADEHCSANIFHCLLTYQIDVTNSSFTVKCGRKGVLVELGIAIHPGNVSPRNQILLQSRLAS